MRNAYKILEAKSERSRHGWKANIRMDLKEIGSENMDWIDLAQDMVLWWASENTGNGFLSVIKGRKFLLKNWRKILLHGDTYVINLSRLTRLLTHCIAFFFWMLFIHKLKFILRSLIFFLNENELVGVWDHNTVCVCVAVYHPFNFCTN
jgi:hypothetical protein